MQNTGNVPWDATDGYRLGSENPHDNTTWGGRVILSAADSIAPQGFKDFVASLAAPATPGTYNFQWRMVQEQVEWFGMMTPNVTVTVNSACDVTQDGATNILDIQREVNQALGVTLCTADINRDGFCNVLDVQRIVNAALSGQCVSP